MKVKHRGKTYIADTKADIARQMLDEGCSVGEVSKAVPMAYSQAHSINQKRQGVRAAFSERDPDRLKNLQIKTKPIAEYAGGKRPTSKARREEAKAWAGKTRDRILDQVVGTATKPLPKGKALGSCTNCNHKLIGLKVGGQMQLVHTEVPSDVYLDKVQFCHAYPASLA